MDEKLIVLAADHNGVELKRHLYDYLKKKGYRCIDLGPFTDKKNVDYTDYAFQLGKIIHRGDVSKGILICVQRPALEGGRGAAPHLQRRRGPGEGAAARRGAGRGGGLRVSQAALRDSR